MITYERSTMSSEKYIGLDVHQATISAAVMGFPGQINHGIHFGNKSVHHSRVLKRPAWNLFRRPSNSPSGCASMISSPCTTARAGAHAARELARSYLTVVKDLPRVMNRLKALYRSWAIPCCRARRLLHSPSQPVARKNP
jgi:hypothetical protein